MGWTAGVSSLFVAFAISSLLGIVMVPLLKKLKFSQTVKDIGPTWHQNKTGTPTMGGIILAAGVFAGSLTGFIILQLNSQNLSGYSGYKQGIALWAGILAALGFGAIGFIDDYIKVFKRRNLGLTALQKTIAQFIITVAYLMTMSLAGKLTTIVDFPFLGQVDFGVWFYPLSAAGIYFMVNAVNLTDGIDGLASSVTAVYGIIFMFISTSLYQMQMDVFAAALTGSCLGFLIWNFYPAKIFMGDTGSMFLGGCVVALGFGIGQPLFVLIVGFVYFIEALSVVIQVISFKLTGKRVFKMSPIHHHFEMCGWGEVKIVAVFSLITAIFGCFGIVSVIYGII